MDRWAQTLDELADGLEQLEAWMDDEGRQVALPGWTPPSDLGPIPPGLRRRAEELSRRIERVEGHASERRARILDELSGADLRRVAATSYLTHGPVASHAPRSDANAP